MSHPDYPDYPKCPRCVASHVAKTRSCDQGWARRHDPDATFTVGYACFGCFKPVTPDPETQPLPERLF